MQKVGELRHRPRRDGEGSEGDRHAVIVLGIDPGTAMHRLRRRSGRRTGRRLPFECGVIRTPARDPLAVAAARDPRGRRRAIARHRPDVLAVEDVFYAKNVRTTVVLGHARGVALLAGEQAGRRVHEFRRRR